MSKGKLAVISGPSGVGKGTVAAALVASRNNIKVSVSATTRVPRVGETDGVNYYFVSHQRFQEMIDNDEFLEHAEYVDNCYGTPKAPVFEMLDRGIDVVLEIDVKGAFQVKEKFSSAALIFLTAPMDELERRILGRQKMEPEELHKRLETARWEFQQSDKFDFVIENKDVDVTVHTVEGILNNWKD